jgi:hypothetical protein
VSGEKTAAAFRQAVPAIAAVLASFGTMYVLCGRAGVNVAPAILSAALCVGLTRRTAAFELRAFAIRLASLPLIVLIAAAIGFVFLHAPWIGAAVFTTAMTAAIAARRFGSRAAAVGRTLALPLIVMLAVPVPASRGAAGVWLALLAGAVSLIASEAASWLAVRLGVVPAREPEKRVQPLPVRAGSRIDIATRMALQMGAALSLAFITGLIAFPTHWPWIVLSAFIVCSGALGRADALYKALLRLSGAIGGTLAAAAAAGLSLHSPVENAAAIFVALFLGIWLREVNYAFWAACATLIFALLQGSRGGDPAALFEARILSIAVGALCGLAATWLVFPIRTRQIVRRRVADAAIAMRGVLAGETHHDLPHHRANLERLAPPVRLHRLLFGRWAREEHPATMLEHAMQLLAEFGSPELDKARAGAELRRLRAMLDLTASKP